MRAQALDLLRFPLCVVIVLIHVLSTNGFVIQGQYVNVAYYPFFSGLYSFVDGFLRGQSVPIYYFIAGFVFFLGVEWTRQKYLQKLKNRVRSLLIPYLIWNTVAVGILFLKLVPGLSRFLSSTSSLNFSWHGLLSCYWFYDNTLIPDPMSDALSLGTTLAPIDVPLWFVRDLIVVVLFTPLLYWIIRRARAYAIVALGLLWFALGYTDYDYPYMLSTAFFYFSFGAYMSINRRDMLVEFGRFFRLSMVAYPLLSILCIVSERCFPECLITIKQLNIFAGLIFAYNLAAWLLNNGKCRVSPFLASASFFVYITHELICAKITRLLYTLLCPTSEGMFLFMYFASFVLTISLLLATFYLLHRYWPAFLKLTTGRLQ